MVKNPSANAGDTRDVGLILGSARSPEVGNGNPLQYSCLENSIDRGAWWATVQQKVGHDLVTEQRQLYTLLKGSPLTILKPGFGICKSGKSKI